MNWKLIFLLSCFGILMGFLSVAGLTGTLEWLYWLIIALCSAYMIGRNAASKPPIHGVVVGVLDGVFNSIVQWLFFTTYIENNPHVAGQLDQGSAPVEPRTMVLLAGPVIGLGYGIVLGLFSAIAAKILKKG